MNEIVKRNKIIIGLRLLQSICALIGLANISSSFRKTVAFNSPSGTTYSTSLGSPESNFVLLTCFSSWILTMLWVCKEVYRSNDKPTNNNMVVKFIFLDFILFILLFAAAVSLFASNYVSYCHYYGYLIRCHNIKTAGSFTILTAFLHLISLILILLTGGFELVKDSFYNRNQMKEFPDTPVNTPYVQTSQTPVAIASTATEEKKTDV